MDDRLARSTRFTHPDAAPAERADATVPEGAVSWSDFRAAVSYDPANSLLIAVPAISGKRAEHPWLGEAVTLHSRVGEAEVYCREYEHGAIYWSARHGAAIVHGMVRDIWALLGWERSTLGLPVGDVRYDRETGVLSGCFEHGTIAWSPAGGHEISVTAPDDGSDAAERETLGHLEADFAPHD